MNISNGHNGAQGHTLPENTIPVLLPMGLSEDSFGKLTRARNACDMLQLLFSEYRLRPGTGRWLCAWCRRADGYLLADLTDIAHSCALIEGGAR